MPSVSDDQMVALIAAGQATGTLADRQRGFLLGANPVTNSRNDLLRIKGTVPIPDVIIVVP